MSKRRDFNFTREETEKLMELVEQYLDVILNNKCTSDINRQKEDAWNLIAEEFNSFTTNHRTAKQLRHKMDNMKKRTELRKRQEELHMIRSKKKLQEGDEDEHSKWLKRIRQASDQEKETSGGDDWGDSTLDWGDKSNDERDDTTTDSPPNNKKHKIQTIYVKPIPTLTHENFRGRNQSEDTENNQSQPSGDSGTDGGSYSKVFSKTQVIELFKLECKQKHQRHKQRLEHEKKLQDAQLNKLALEARIYETQLNKTNLEVKQLTRRLEREEELHQARMKREEHLHKLQVERVMMGVEPIASKDLHNHNIKENFSEDG